MGALNGITVLDLSRIVAGPLCTQTLGDYGADVIKVEKPGVGDDARAFGPPFLTSKDGTTAGDSLYFTCFNRNKRSVSIDIATSEGQAQLRQLAVRADVLVENFKTGDLARYGMDYSSIRAVNPSIIYCSITGYGQDGPYAGRPGYDLMFQGEAGFMSYTGRGDDETGAGPQRAAVPIIDMFTGMQAASAILAALHHRHITGKGQHIDIALFDVAITLNAGMNLMWLANGDVPQRTGNTSPFIVPYNVFETRDGYVIAGAGGDAQWPRLCSALNIPQLGTDPRLATNAGRSKHKAEVNAAVAAAILPLSIDECVARLRAAKVPVGPVNTLDRVFADPHVLHRELVFELPHPVSGTLPMVRNPVHFSETPINYVAPPLAGQHSAEILAELEREVVSRSSDPIARPARAPIDEQSN